MNDQTNIVTLAFSDQVRLSLVGELEPKVREMHLLFEKVPGFISADVVRHPGKEHMGYTVQLRFENEEASERWRVNTEIMKKLAEVEAVTGGAVHTSKCVGLGMWVDHVAGAELKRPPFWKQLVLSVLGVYPTLVLLRLITEPVVGGLPPLLGMFVIVTLLSALLINPIMPMLSRLLQPWLSR
ncbi:hypothetical protein [Phaeobacter gallaeciensis]|uniref:ABM domain-containing protein n=1 Tax=Phaeobacter gallaeciensis TaxID=60890 RepID=A0AAD0ECK1_9RHOB|nr:hypothetical protein [Phaeobacter gallaeciensis]AHD09157.1 Uncharacterized protein in bacteria [Phaeobacter gallaeciensis DSM 26640]ATE92420.1 putative protein in bacteria [Phaeobacter gallaeciensis]ATE97758.1 putative protein in bacteria [Phaeobacter gallaeciensis]ATF01085.1 putative protein in bacteria [Phaeobacter gallaeciensis]ATF05465.1 putative protein in bacteria [Phaeobacter gallaeciensis]